MRLARVILTCDWHLIVQSDQEHIKRVVFLTNKRVKQGLVEDRPEKTNKDKKQPEC